MSTVAEIRAAIVAKHADVPNVGNVHAFERYVKDQARLRELFVMTPSGGGNQQIRGWWWRRVATMERTESTGTVLNLHTWECRGYMALADEQATELEFDQLIEDFRAAMRDDPTLGGVCDQNSMGEEPDGVQLLDAGPVLFCGVLCHSAVMQLRTWSYL